MVNKIIFLIYNLLYRFETSAKENINIDEAGNCLVENILKKDPKAQSKEEKKKGTIDLNKSSNNSNEKKLKEDSKCEC